MLTLAKMVDINFGMYKFVLISERFLCHSKSQLVLDYIKQHVDSALYNRKLSYTDYSLLIHELTKDDNKYLLNDSRDVLLDMPMAGWFAEIDKLQAKFVI